MSTTREATQGLVFAEPWSITEEYEDFGIKIYVPREFGAVFSKNTKYDRHFISFKSRRGAEQFLLRHGAQTAPIENVPEPILIRGPQERRWNRVARQYESVMLTQEQIEASRRREHYVAMFDPCNIGDAQ